jgi:hypothetical protein
MTKIAFSGPSLFGVDLGAFLQIEFRPPAASGDILSAVGQGATAIGLIDGLYGDRAAVWHKEILYALSQGIPVLGAASMGALRAAECEAFGMVGIGDVFRSYQDGFRTSDADVAILHAPAELGYRPLTIALVDAEATIAGMADQLNDGDLALLIESARTQHFSARTWRSIAAGAKLAPEIAKMLAGNAVSVKTADALQLLNTLQSDDMRQRPLPGWTFQNTQFFQQIQMRQRD